MNSWPTNKGFLQFMGAPFLHKYVGMEYFLVNHTRNPHSDEYPHPRAYRWTSVASSFGFV